MTPTQRREFDDLYGSWEDERDELLAEGMERSLLRERPLNDLLIENYARRDRYKKAGSYTLAEKYGLLDIYPPASEET